jgi:hypothetical protein
MASDFADGIDDGSALAVFHDDVVVAVGEEDFVEGDDGGVVYF